MKLKRHKQKEIGMGNNLASLVSSVDRRCEELGERICVCNENQKIAIPFNIRNY